ncbi:DUF924 family protein [Brevundimonas vesicularis]|uniref:DUF924 family protein n=1 Tax=Brevundimonas vesicularis TaxID=41276 RepID=UPI0038D3861C
MTSKSLPSPADVVNFWIQAGPEKWFAKDLAFDEAFKTACLDAHYAAARRELNGWMDTAEGALALILLLDQLPRNAFRDTAHMFATDPLALMFANQAIERGLDRHVDANLRPFILMPLMHSESLGDQDRLLELLEEAEHPETWHFAVIHRDIIVKYGRYPHRNASLGRATTPGETEFLGGDNFKG